MHLLNEDRIFEDSHNNMISLLHQFQSYHTKDKIIWAQNILA
jgi:hypothetical protein